MKTLSSYLSVINARHKLAYVNENKYNIFITLQYISKDGIHEDVQDYLNN